jgi:hypothetical protein
VYRRSDCLILSRLGSKVEATESDSNIEKTREEYNRDQISNNKQSKQYDETVGLCRL